MIAHKFPGIQLDLSSVEVIWLHFTRFFMDLEANFDSSMHVFKEPTGVYYKLTGNYSPKILEEAKQKTITYVQKNKIEMLNTELEYKHYMNICQELRLRFPKIYIQLLHYNVFDYVSRRLHQKFGYKQALQDYQELIKKKKRFCYLICDKAYFPQIKDIFYQLAEPIEKQAQATSLRRTTSTTAASTSTPQQQVPLQKIQFSLKSTTAHNRSNSTAVANTISGSNVPINITNQEEINIHNFESTPSPRLTMGMKSNSYYEEEDEYSYGNQGSVDQSDFKGLDIQKEDFPCLSDAQVALNQQLSSQLNDSNNSNSNGGSNPMSDASKKKNNKKQKKKQQQAIKQQQSQQLTKAISQGLNQFLDTSKDSSMISKSASSQPLNQHYSKNVNWLKNNQEQISIIFKKQQEQFDEWDFELPTYKQSQNDPNLSNKALSSLLSDEYPGYITFPKQQNSSNVKGIQQMQPIEQKSKSVNPQKSEQQNQNIPTSGKKESSNPGSTTTTQQSSKKNSGQGFTTQITQPQQPNMNQPQTFPSTKQTQNTNQQQPFTLFKQNELLNISQKSSKSDKNDTAKEIPFSQKSSEEKLNDFQMDHQIQRQLLSGSKSSDMHHKHSFSSDYQSQQMQQSYEQQLSMQGSHKHDPSKKKDDSLSEQIHKEIIINQTPIQLKPQHQSHPPGLPPPPHSEDLSSMRLLLSEQSSNVSSQVVLQDDPQGSSSKISDVQVTKQKNTELSEKQQKLMKTIKSEPFNPNKGSISLKIDAIIVEQDFKTEELLEKQRIYADEYTETIKIMYKENQYCLKIYKNMTAYNLRRVNSYLENLRILAAPRIIRSFGKTVTCLKQSFDLFILLDYKERNLLQAIKQKHIVSFNDKLLVFWQVAQAIQHIHGHIAQENMIHGNIKPENILLSSKKKVFLSDFYVLKNKENKYRPKNEGQTQEADIWSFGLITYYLFTEHLIDTEKAMFLLSEQVLLNQIYKPANNDLRVIYNLIERMIDLNPANRPDIEEIVSHLKPIIQKKNKELNVGLNVQSSAFENIPHISQQNLNTASLH